MEILSLDLEEDYHISPHGNANCVSAGSRLAYMLWMHQLTHVWTSLDASNSYIYTALQPVLCASK